jgi:hypothetical protein
VRTLTSLNNIAAGQTLTTKINDWAFIIEDGATDAPNTFSAYQSSDVSCIIKYSLVVVTDASKRPANK